MMRPEQLRQKFLTFFEKRDHRVVESSPVVPQGDPTLLFTNAGMNQFKDVLLGNETRGYKRATSVQKCIRAGGKHNDLDEVGKDGRHLTFFEMMGNWSFGDYWKKDAIKWAWEFLTKELGLDPERLYVTVYKDDDESYDIWNTQVGISDQKILRLGDVENGDEENFWSMDTTGPCGPCTEIHYDLYPDDPLDFSKGYNDDRILEIWNLVFTQYNRDAEGRLHELSMKSVDTGSGLERLLSIVNGSKTVFDTELFLPVEEAFRELHGLSPGLDEQIRVVSDHMKSILFALADGAKFSNTGAGYVLRKMLRRSHMAGHEMGIENPFLIDLGETVAEIYSDRYPEVRAHYEVAKRFIRREEEKFVRSLERGKEIFTKMVLLDLQKSDRSEVSGEEMFDLHTTYGLPPEVTEKLAQENGCSVDWQEYEVLFREHQEISKG